ncbi:hypothetical protein EDD29_8259 [Actinocorallia herbida]|uniref:Uncharacterized protein n=1 Tax=Actinocorallia herbida TaxID=58109 RepID=A0A3N1DBP2_9ACTN|nr:hypothetical protein [Actinocorallia herbida]ROO90528.1 hypothetical protein EDD29_8259 [Actinocorallia herbida]
MTDEEAPTPLSGARAIWQNSVDSAIRQFVKGSGRLPTDDETANIHRQIDNILTQLGCRPETEDQR